MTKTEFRQFAESMLRHTHEQAEWADEHGKAMVAEVAEHDPHLAQLLSMNHATMRTIANHICKKLG